MEMGTQQSENVFPDLFFLWLCLPHKK